MIPTKKTFAALVSLLFLGLFLVAPVTAETVFEWNWEDGWGFWAPDNGVWEVGEPAAGPTEAHSLPNCAGTNLSGNYPRYTNSRLISPSINLPAIGMDQEIVLRFFQWFAYNKEPNASDDQGQVQVQFFDGQTWSSWETLGSVYYSSGAWSLRQCDLTQYAGMPVKIGFLHVDYYAAYGGEAAGWYIDDIAIERRALCLFNNDAVEDFESGWGCWWADVGVWEVGEPTSGPGSALSGAYCVATVLGGNYPRYTDSRLVSPPIDLPTDCNQIYARWWQWFSYNKEPNATDDRGQIQIQTWEEDHWSDWQTLAEVVFSSADWTPGQLDVIAYAGKRVRVGFQHVDYHAAYGGEAAGWYIDDFEIFTDCPPQCSAQFKISPSSGFYGSTQEFDMMLLIKPSEGCSVANISATLNGKDVTNGLKSCFVTGTLSGGGETRRCPAISEYLKAGFHQFHVLIELDDGATVDDTARWTILTNSEP